MGAAAGVDGDLAEAFGTFLCGWIGGSGGFARTGDESVDGGNDEEVDGGRDQEEADQGGDEFSDGKRGAADVENDTVEIRFTYDESDERVDHALDERGDDRSESGADDDTYGEIDDVAAQDELLEPG